jgi:hypothetical protein
VQLSCELAALTLSRRQRTERDAQPTVKLQRRLDAVRCGLASDDHGQEQISKCDSSLIQTMELESVMRSHLYGTMNECLQRLLKLFNLKPINLIEKMHITKSDTNLRICVCLIHRQRVSIHTTHIAEQDTIRIILHWCSSIVRMMMCIDRLTATVCRRRRKWT